MKIKLIHAVLAFLFFTSIANSENQTPQQDEPSSEIQTVTLYSPTDKLKEVKGDIKACFSFRLGGYARCGSKDVDLEYGFVKTNYDDYLRLSMLDDSRTVIKDLGQKNWDKSFRVPKLEPFPERKPGQKRKIGFYTNDENDDGMRITAPVVIGHTYVVHVKEKASDFYVLFRVENFALDQFCKITWKRIPEPGKKAK